MAHCDPFYLNMVITNKAEVIEAKVSEKVGKGMFGLGLARKAASKVAASMVTDEKLASTVSDKMVAAIPAALAERGISADIAKKYGKGAYFVLRVHVTELDKIKLLTTAKGEEFAAKFGQLIELIDYFGATEGKGASAVALTRASGSSRARARVVVLPRASPARPFTREIGAEHRHEGPAGPDGEARRDPATKDDGSRRARR